MSELFNWGNNYGYSSTMGNSQSMLRGGASPQQVGMNSMQTPGFDPSAAAGGGGGFMDGMLGSTNAEGIKTPGWGGMALGGANSLFNGWLGMKKLGMAKDQLRENKRQFNMNWGAQKKTVNNQLSNDQQFRNSVNPESQAVGQYMGKWGIE